VNASDPDLRKFAERGGKMILDGGWNDSGVPPDEVVAYYNNVVAKAGAKTTHKGAPVHGARHALRRQRRRRPFRSVSGSAAVGGGQAGARHDHRFEG
jgi:hypothetical protein